MKKLQCFFLLNINDVEENLVAKFKNYHHHQLLRMMVNHGNDQVMTNLIATTAVYDFVIVSHINH